MNDLEDASLAIGAIESDPHRHRVAARRIAERYFEATRVLADVLWKAGVTPRPIVDDGEDVEP